MELLPRTWFGHECFAFFPLLQQNHATLMRTILSHSPFVIALVDTWSRTIKSTTRINETASCSVACRRSRSSVANIDDGSAVHVMHCVRYGSLRFHIYFTNSNRSHANRRRHGRESFIHDYVRDMLWDVCDMRQCRGQVLFKRCDMRQCRGYVLVRRAQTSRQYSFESLACE